MAAALALAFAPDVASAAQGRGHTRGRGARAADEVIVINRGGHRRIIRDDYYRAYGLPPGLAKRQSLPPGLAKQLRERGGLPPGLQKRQARFKTS